MRIAQASIFVCQTTWSFLQGAKTLLVQDTPLEHINLLALSDSGGWYPMNLGQDWNYRGFGGHTGIVLKHSLFIKLHQTCHLHGPLSVGSRNIRNVYLLHICASMLCSKTAVQMGHPVLTSMLFSSVHIYFQFLYCFEEFSSICWLFTDVLCRSK